MMRGKKKGYVHTMEAILASIILFTFLFSVHHAPQIPKLSKTVDLEQEKVLQGNFSYLASQFRELYPLRQSSFTITKFNFLEGRFNDSFIQRFNGSYSFAEIVLWLNSLTNLTVMFNGEIIALKTDFRGVARMEVSPINANNTLIVNSSSSGGTYNLILWSRTSFGPQISNTSTEKITYFYYPSYFNPVELEVRLT